MSWPEAVHEQVKHRCLVKTSTIPLCPSPPNTRHKNDWNPLPQFDAQLSEIVLFTSATSFSPWQLFKVKKLHRHVLLDGQDPILALLVLAISQFVAVAIIEGVGWRRGILSTEVAIASREVDELVGRAS